MTTYSRAKKTYKYTEPFWKQDACVGLKTGSSKLIGFVSGWIHKPSVQFPEASGFVSLNSNGRFVRAKVDVGDIQLLIALLANMKQTLEANQAQFSADALVMRAQKDALADIQNRNDERGDEVPEYKDEDFTGDDAGINLTPEMLSQAMPFINQFLATAKKANEGVIKDANSK